MEGFRAYVPGPGFAEMPPRAVLKRSSLPNPHSGDDFSCPFTCGPTAARMRYVAGPGERAGPPVLSSACYWVMKTFSWSSRELLPKPNCGDVLRLLSACAPNVERVPKAWNVACAMAWRHFVTIVRLLGNDTCVY